MRYTHGCKPRKPYNMIIQENHAANRANSIIAYGAGFVKKAPIESWLRYANYPIEKFDYAIHTVDHQMRKNFAEKDDEHINDDNAVAL